jgi:hypothetical protein
MDFQNYSEPPTAEGKMTGNRRQKSKMRRSIFILVGVFLIFLSGCAELNPPHPVDILTHPLGKGPLRSGMDKKEVISAWGEPDEVSERSINKFGMTKEKWIYRARIENVPIGVGYLTKTYYLYFEGDSLIRFRELE